MASNSDRQIRVIVFSGPPCSGKSTIAESLSRRTGIPHLEMDGIRARIIPDSEQNEKDRRISYRAMHVVAESLLRCGHSVIVSATYGPLQHREELERLAYEIKATLWLVECKVEPDVAVQRFAGRREPHPAVDLTPERVRDLAKTFAYSGKGLTLDTSGLLSTCQLQVEEYISDGSPVAFGDWRQRGDSPSAVTVSRHSGERLSPRNRRTAARRLWAARLLMFLSFLILLVGVLPICLRLADEGFGLTLSSAWAQWLYEADLAAVLDWGVLLVALAVFAGGFLPVWEYCRPIIDKAKQISGAGKVPRYEPCEELRPADAELYLQYFARTAELSRHGFLLSNVPVYFVAAPEGTTFDVETIRTAGRASNTNISARAAQLGLDWHGFCQWRLDRRSQEYNWPLWKRALWNLCIRRSLVWPMKSLWGFSVRCTDIDARDVSHGRLVIATEKCSYADYVCRELSVNLRAQDRLPDMREFFEGEAWGRSDIALSAAASAPVYSMAVGVAVLVTTRDRFFVLHRRSSMVSEGAGGLACTATGHTKWLRDIGFTNIVLPWRRNSPVSLKRSVRRELEEEMCIREHELVPDEKPFVGAAFNLLHGRDLNFYAHYECTLTHEEVSRRRVRAKDAWEIASLVFVPVTAVTPDGTGFAPPFAGLLPHCNRHLRAALLALARSGRLARLQKGSSSGPAAHLPAADFVEPQGTSAISRDQ